MAFRAGTSEPVQYPSSQAAPKSLPPRGRCAHRGPNIRRAGKYLVGGCSGYAVRNQTSAEGGHRSALPLPAEVGEAIAAYLRVGRPASTSRFVFLRAKAPIRGFQSSIAVLSVVRHALARAGIDTPRKGAHQFRHALACEMLRQGASLPDIGQILRHRSPQTTAIYAKVDLASLRPLALPWPGAMRHQMTQAPSHVRADVVP